MAKGTISSAMPDLFPTPLYLAKFTVGATTGDVLITSSADYNICDIPTNLLIYDVGWQVTTAFNSDVDLTIGLAGDDPNGWADVADVNATVADTAIYWSKDVALTSALAAGTEAKTSPAYSAMNVLCPATGDNLNVTVQSTTASAGVMDVYVLYQYTDSPNPDVGRWERLQRTHQFKAGLGV